jgi:hypothetical protein
VFLAYPASSQATSALDFDGASPEEILLAQRSIADTVTAAPPMTEPVTPSVATPSATQEVNPKLHRSTGKAFLLNLAIPGAGHLYAGETRGLVNMGLEGVAWAAYLYYHDRGKSKEKEFETYADGHWDYNRWISNNPQYAGSPEDSLILYFRDHNRQQYYEDIGKLPHYWGGWTNDDDRNFYRGIRAHSNNFLKNAHTAVAGAFVNRIVSAVDVLRLMKSKTHAALGADTKIRFKVRTRPFARDNAFGFVVTRKLH